MNKNEQDIYIPSLTENMVIKGDVYPMWRNLIPRDATSEERQDIIEKAMIGNFYRIIKFTLAQKDNND